MSNQCPYSLEIAFNPNTEVYSGFPCIKDRHSHGDHQARSGIRWRYIDTRETSNTQITADDVPSRMD